MLTIRDLMGEAAERLKRVTSKGEYAGPCPKCGGTDRFRLWPEANYGVGKWYCRGCDAGGDLVEYFHVIEGLPKADEWRNGKLIQEGAFTAAGRPSENYRRPTVGNGRNPPLTPRWEPEPAKEPAASWQEKAGAFVTWCQEKLLADPDRLTWLEKERGLTLETVKARRLGWNPADQYRELESWGLEPKLNDKGNPSKLFLPAGLVIPTFRGETLLRVKVRKPEAGEWGRYYFVPGSSNDCMIFGEGRGVVLVVESELDAVLLEQDAGDIAGVVALGSSSIRPDSHTAAVLEKAGVVLVALDSDEAGGKAAWGWWRKNFPDWQRWPVIDGKDPTEAKKNGLPLREWVLAGFPSAWIPDPSRAEPAEPSDDPEYLEEIRQERAAIMEFDGGLTREEAERRAGLVPAIRAAAG
jgi:hypothetical protein